MKLKMFAIRDDKVDAFMRPFFAQTTREGMRIWEDSVNSGDTGFSRHPQDYCLFELGEFNMADGTFTSAMQPKALGLAAEYLKKPTTEQVEFPFRPATMALNQMAKEAIENKQ